MKFAIIIFLDSLMFILVKKFFTGISDYFQNGLVGIYFFVFKNLTMYYYIYKNKYNILYFYIFKLFVLLVLFLEIYFFNGVFTNLFGSFYLIVPAVFLCFHVTKDTQKNVVMKIILILIYQFILLNLTFLNISE
ncbi:hypothetical protein JY401_11790 [Fusobacterium animalis]|uniref:hypothetical protein n=1 Tax=Fusobacterium animalis TaxID=76859 RepID=UPI001C6EA558|nr:hypothetical protein [Fusobacterium animalis]QYR67773.1 hypothetical protein JY401_11790 [Fusobacterium animalis]